MSCIVAVKAGDKVYLGADTGVFSPSGRQARVRTSKIFYKGDMLFGAVGTIRYQQIIEYSLEVPEHKEGLTPLEYLCVEFVPCLQECLEENGLLVSADSGDNDVAETAGAAIIVYRGEIFLLEDQFDLLQFERDYMATGAGEDAAYGSLFVTEKLKEKIKPTTRVRLALEAAVFNNCFVKPPFHYKTAQTAPAGR